MATKNKELITRLEKYGFYDFQIDEIIKKGKINSSHGKYVLDKNTMTLTLNGERKEF